MKATEFFSDRIHRLLLRVVLAVIMALLLLATGTQLGIVIILGIIWSLVFVGGQMTDFFRSCSRLRELEEIMEGLDKKYLFAECVQTGKTVYERKLFGLFRRAGRAMISAVSDAEASSREYREYVESFVHEVKTPITTAKLICRKVDTENRKKLSSELAKIQAHIERVLFYARSESTQKDFFVCAENLKELVTQAIGEYGTFLIANDIRVETRELDQIVFTDRKWTIFLLGQLLQNSARYRGKEPVIIIFAERETKKENFAQDVAMPFLKDSGILDKEESFGERVRLTVQDNGIGILAHELPRVFERGFTGSNGRVRGGSTGMGLYLCKKLADHLGIEIEIRSECGVGTTVVLVFAAGKNFPVGEESFQNCKEN